MYIQDDRLGFFSKELKHPSQYLLCMGSGFAQIFAVFFFL